MSGALTPERAPAGRALELSVIVCSHNGAEHLPTVLRSLARQSLDADHYEVIVVDDGSTDRTSNVAAEAGVRVIRLAPNAGLAAARNAGVSATTGEIVAFTDDDCEVAPGWAISLLERFSDPAVDGVGGRVVPDSPNRFLRGFLTANNPLTPLKADLLESNRLAYRFLLYIRRTFAGDNELPQALYSVVGANMAFRRRLIFELDGFDEVFRFGAEEEDFCLRAHARPGGARLVYADDAVVTHWFHNHLRDSIRRSRAYGRGNARRVLKHPHTRLIVYPCPVLAAVLVALGTASRRRWVAGAAPLLPLLAYPRWATLVLQHRSPEPLTYPFIQLAQETAAMVGELDGLRAGYERVPSRHLKHL